MKVLFCTPRLPYPPLKGDQAVAYYRAKYLSRHHELHLISFIESSRESQYSKALLPYFTSITLVQLPRFQSLMNMTLGLLNLNLPLQVSYYRSHAFAFQLRSLLQRHHFDLAHIFLLRMVPYAQLINLPTVVELVDSMELNLERRAFKASGLKRWVLSDELRRIRSYEARAIQSFDAVTVVSQRDAAVLGQEKVQVIPLGVDIDVYSPAIEPVNTNRIIFSGNMSYEPNITAVHWFIDNCYHALRQHVPDFEFVISGVNPNKEITKLGQLQGVKVTGFVPSMVDVLRSAKVAIAPMQTGSGMQFKILEAMACGLPVVTTSYGLGDIKATDGKELEVADFPEDFVGKIIHLLEADPYRLQMGQAARQFVLRNHSWDAMAEKVEQIYAKLVPQLSTFTEQ